MNTTLAAPDWTAISAIATSFAALAGFAAALAAIIYTVFTYKLLVETRRMREAQTRPIVVMYPSRRPHNFQIYDIIIENCGGSSALDVKFELPENLRVRGLPKTSQIRTFEGSPLERGIASLPPGVKVKVFWGLGTVLFEQAKDKQFDVRIEFRDGLGNQFNEVCSFRKSDIDNQELENPDPVSDGLRNIEDELKRVREQLRRMHVITERYRPDRSRWQRQFSLLDELFGRTPDQM